MLVDLSRKEGQVVSCEERDAGKATSAKAVFQHRKGEKRKVMKVVKRKAVAVGVRGESIMPFEGKGREGKACLLAEGSKVVS